MQQARELLGLGVMPLLPPARRDWREDQVVRLQAGGACIAWPPTNWSKLSSDRKLLQWEFAAMQLEQGLTGRIPDMDRQDLRDRFNMLALPGTHAHPVAEEDSFSRKARIYSYLALVAIATGKSSTAKDQELLHIWMGARKNRNTDTDSIIETIDCAGVGPRLDV